MEKNECTSDRVVRVILGIILLYVGAIYMGLSGILSYIVVIVGLLLLVTGLKNQSEYLITYSGRTANRKLQAYCDKARIPRRPFHALRATCIKFCQAAGWAPEQVSKLTGNTIAVIPEHYSTRTCP
jgi:integrase